MAGKASAFARLFLFLGPYHDLRLRKAQTDLVAITPIAGHRAACAYLVVAGYRSRPCEETIRAWKLPGAAYGVTWSSGSWSDASASVPAIAVAARYAGTAVKWGRTAATAASLGSAAVCAAGISAAQFRLRHRLAVRDGRRLAMLLSQATKQESVLDLSEPIHFIGHSLGTVVIRSCLNTLRLHSLDRSLSITDVHLFGGAARRTGWDQLATMIQGRLKNYFSPRDLILRAAPLASRLAGTGSICESCVSGNVINQDVSDQLPHPFNAVAHHSGHWSLVPRLV